MGWQASVAQWGSTQEERAQPFPCDRLIAAPELTLFRAIDVAAPRALTFRWLCQLRAAPYSYDSLDNFGVRSPQELTPGLEALEPGQRMQTIFRLVEFEPGRSLTMLYRGRLFGQVACTYRADGLGERRSRIVVKVNVSASATRAARAAAAAGAAGRRPADDAPPAAQPEAARGADRERPGGGAGRWLSRCDTSASWRRRGRRGAPPSAPTARR